MVLLFYLSLSFFSHHAPTHSPLYIFVFVSVLYLYFSQIPLLRFGDSNSSKVVYFCVCVVTLA